MNCALMKTHGQSHVDLQLWPNQQFFLIFMNNAFLFWLHLHTFMMEISSIMPMLASVNSWLILRDLIFIHLKNKEFVFLNDRVRETGFQTLCMCRIKSLSHHQVCCFLALCLLCNYYTNCYLCSRACDAGWKRWILCSPMTMKGSRVLTGISLTRISFISECWR